MPKTLDATFDGEVIRFDDPIDLKPNTRVKVIIETLPIQKKVIKLGGLWAKTKEITEEDISNMRNEVWEKFGEYKR